jgi:hypothetical protein
MAKKSSRPAKKKSPKATRVPARGAAARDRGQTGAGKLHAKGLADGVALPAGPVYLYAITAGTISAPSWLRASGIAGSGHIVGVPAGRFTAWASAIDAHGFAESLERNIENLDWLAEATLRHQNAIHAIAAATKETLLPTRFGVVFSSADALIEDVASRAKELEQSAKHVAGCEEWGVKVFHVGSPSARAAFRTASSGADYLRQKAAALSTDGAEDGAIQAFARELAKVARASSQTGKVSSGQKNLQWQATFLVPTSKRKQWDNVLLRYATEWGEERSIECTGPWPPYSFVSE